tara:strand:+ start:1789 stop:2316 length:528 start_codon:yes stop_codon:yes gene_type:complete
MSSEKYIELIKKSINEINKSEIDKIVNFLIKNRKKSKIYLAGNGASASIANHLATDFTKASKFDARTFNESNLITCLSNDYGYENWITQALKFYLKKDDILILISSSGTSKNIINAAKFCKKKKIKLITLSGFSEKNPLKKLGNFNFYVKSNIYNVIEATHLVILLSIVEGTSKI